jgi:hypothetical protein
MMATLKSILSYETLGVVESFQRTYFGQVSLRLATSNNNICEGLKYVFIKNST